MQELAQVRAADPELSAGPGPGPGPEPIPTQLGKVVRSRARGATVTITTAGFRFDHCHHGTPHITAWAIIVTEGRRGEGAIVIIVIIQLNGAY